MHSCPVKDCKRSVPDHHLMCGRHWRLVPEDVNKRVYKTCNEMHSGKPGARKEYVAARNEAIAAVEHAMEAKCE